jgi:hypothetical protein
MRDGLDAGLRTIAHLPAAATFAALAFGHHRAFTIGAARHLAIPVFRHHGAHLAVLALAAGTGFAVGVFGAALLAAASGFAAGRIGIAAGAAFVVAGRRGVGLGCALGHQGQGHNEHAKYDESFRFHDFPQNSGSAELKVRGHSGWAAVGPSPGSDQAWPAIALDSEVSLLIEDRFCEGRRSRRGEAWIALAERRWRDGRGACLQQVRK